MTKPCASCPFLKVGGVRLRKERAEEIAVGLLDSQGIVFPCHKTVDYSEYENSDSSDYSPQDGHIHCAGALIFAEKNGNATQMMRIMERLGQYDPEKLMADSEVVASVFDDLDDMLESQEV